MCFCERNDKVLSNMKEAFRGLAAMGHLSLQLLIPILIGAGGGIWLDNRFGFSPWCVIIGVIIGITAAFRNLYVWSVQQVHRSANSERSIRAMHESGMRKKEQPEVVKSDRKQ